MRRAVGSVILTGLVTGFVVATALPAAAHVCPGAALTPVGQPHTIQVLVRIEQQPVTDVSVTMPAGITLNRVDAKAGWNSVRRGATVNYRGGTFAPYTCQYFSLGITAPTQGTFPIRVVSRDPSGKVAIDSAADPVAQLDPNFSSIIYAGVKPPSPSSSSSGPSAVTIAGAVLIAAGVILVGVLGFRAWRNRGLDEDADDGDEDGDDGAPPARDAELQARVDEFKKRTPGRPPAN